LKYGIAETLLLVGTLLIVISGLLMVSDIYAAEGECPADSPRESCRVETQLSQRPL
jgi:hypothetical protein